MMWWRFLLFIFLLLIRLVIVFLFTESGSYWWSGEDLSKLRHPLLIAWRTQPGVRMCNKHLMAQRPGCSPQDRSRLFPIYYRYLHISHVFRTLCSLGKEVVGQTNIIKIKFTNLFIPFKRMASMFMFWNNEWVDI